MLVAAGRLCNSLLSCQCTLSDGSDASGVAQIALRSDRMAREDRCGSRSCSKVARGRISIRLPPVVGLPLCNRFLS